MAKETKQNWEAALKELTRIAEKSPSSAVFQKLADCYEHLDEREEAAVFLDLAHSHHPESHTSSSIYPS